MHVWWLNINYKVPEQSSLWWASCMPSCHPKQAEDPCQQLLSWSLQCHPVLEELLYEMHSAASSIRYAHPKWNPQLVINFLCEEEDLNSNRTHIFLRTSTCFALRSYSCLIFFLSASNICSFSMLNSCQHIKSIQKTKKQNKQKPMIN